jgi:uncharacterized protein YgiM (DUF1202 family)
MTISCYTKYNMKRLVLFITLIFTSFLFSACTNPLAKQATSGLQVQITDGVAASVYLDGNYVEKTPFISKELNPGEYTLKIQPDDPELIPYETQINLRPGLLSVVTWRLAERPEFSGGVVYEMEPISSKNSSELSFVTIPDGVIVSVAGKDKDFSPVIMPNINPGHIEFEVSLPSYGIQKHTINAIPGYRMLVTVKLAKENLSQPTQKITQEIETINVASGEAKGVQTQASDSAVVKDTTNSAQLKNPIIGSKVTIKPTNFFVNGKEVLRVRDLPNSAGKELGFAKVGTDYKYLENTEGNWFNIQFENESGWVSNQYAQLVK